MLLRVHVRNSQDKSFVVGLAGFRALQDQFQDYFACMSLRLQQALTACSIVSQCGAARSVGSVAASEAASPDLPNFAVEGWLHGHPAWQPPGHPYELVRSTKLSSHKYDHSIACLGGASQHEISSSLFDQWRRCNSQRDLDHRLQPSRTNHFRKHDALFGGCLTVFERLSLREATSCLFCGHTATLCWDCSLHANDLLGALEV